MVDSELQKKEINTKPVPSVTLRSIVIGLLLLPANVYWVGVAELKYDSEATALPLFLYPVVFLFFLTLVNLGVRKLWRKAELQQGELLTIYVMLVISTSLAAYGMMQDLFALYFMIAIAITRLRTEFGAPHGIDNHPLDVMVTSLGATAIGAQNLTTMSFFYWFNRRYRPHPMPNHFEALKMADAAGMNNRRLFVAMMLAAVAAIIAIFWVDLSLIYHDGTASRLGAFRNWVGEDAFERLQKHLFYPQAADLLRVSFMGVGMCAVFLLRILRMRFLFWPFHPAGYALAVSFAHPYTDCRSDWEIGQ